ncbi:hypothetical protein [Paracoccus endophyticus]|uniref:hypothetical protein n=1 Tax=Paracoccus endophyticus TaxID=2233774 RepID=UPI0013A6C63D|nr:hypothetical protein [Paracoccus endophyticus]
MTASFDTPGRRERRDDPALKDRTDGRAAHAAEGCSADAGHRAADAAAHGGPGRAEDEGCHGIAMMKDGA